ncbi:MAG: hypothetical protein PHU81_01640, partial [Acidobacteriota bacterium]|nr:hypothetical protein [Acidobacteriota bacterium]
QYTMDNYTATTWYVTPVGWIWVEGYTNPDNPTGDVSEVTYASVPGSNVTIGYPGKKLVAPRTYEASFGVEQQLFEDMSLGLRYIRRWERKLIEDVDASALDMDALMKNGELIWDETRWVPIEVTDPYDGKTITFYGDGEYRAADIYMVNVPGLKRDYNGFEVTLRKRFSLGWSFDLSYVYSKATGLVQNTYWESELDEPLYNNPNAHTNAYGRMSLDRPHQLKLSAVVNGPWGINISTYTRFFSGYASRRQVDSYPLAGYDAGNWVVNAEPYGSYRLPSLFLIDLRLEKQFKFSNSMSFRVFGDVFNLTNANTTTSWRTTSNHPSIPFQYTQGILDARSFRIGAKFSF